MIKELLDRAMTDIATIRPYRIVKRKKISVQNVADELGVSHNQVYAWLRGDIPSKRNQENIRNLIDRIEKDPDTFKNGISKSET
jgi:transcriptional regulator with XRE-family HTH domain